MEPSPSASMLEAMSEDVFDEQLHELFTVEKSKKFTAEIAAARTPEQVRAHDFVRVTCALSQLKHSVRPSMRPSVVAIRKRCGNVREKAQNFNALVEATTRAGMQVILALLASACKGRFCRFADNRAKRIEIINSFARNCAPDDDNARAKDTNSRTPMLPDTQQISVTELSGSVISCGLLLSVFDLLARYLCCNTNECTASLFCGSRLEVMCFPFVVAKFLNFRSILSVGGGHREEIFMCRNE